MTRSFPKIAIWGDSILKGVVFNHLRGRYEQLTDHCVALVSAGLGMDIQNKSRFGCTIDKGYAQLERALDAGLACDAVLLEYGGNDCDFDWVEVAKDPDAPHQPKTDLTRFCDIFQNMIDLLREKGIQPLLMSLPPIVSERYLDFLVGRGLDRKRLMMFLGDVHQIYRWHESYSLAITRLAEKNRCLYAPVREHFLIQRNSLDMICMDGLHPNEAGHRQMQSVFTAMALG